MRSVAILLTGLAVICVAIYTDLLGQLALFVMIGQIPFTSYSLQPVTMLAFWLLIPITLVVAALLRQDVWRMVEFIGQSSQRKLNLRHRSHASRNKLADLVVIALVHVAMSLPESTASDPSLYLRRRFAPIPA